MSRRIEIELTSSQDDGTWTWRAAGAKNPKGVLDGGILQGGASVGDVIKVEVEQGVDGMSVLSVVGGRQRNDSNQLLELIGGADFDPVVETRAKVHAGTISLADHDSRRHLSSHSARNLSV